MIVTKEKLEWKRREAFYLEMVRKTHNIKELLNLYTKIDKKFEELKKSRIEHLTEVSDIQNFTNMPKMMFPKQLK